MNSTKEPSAKALIGRRIRAARALAGCTQLELSEATGIPVRSLQAYETGTTAAPAARLLLIANACDVRLNFLLFENDVR